jgi:hypothetical protein
MVFLVKMQEDKHEWHEILHTIERAKPTVNLVVTFGVGGMIYEQLSNRNPHHKLSSLSKKIDVRFSY